VSDSAFAGAAAPAAPVVLAAAWLLLLVLVQCLLQLPLRVCIIASILLN
jgi:hypothetical protein